MIRIFLQFVIPLVLPTVIYFAYVAYLRRKDPNAEITVGKPWFRLIGAGLILVMISLGAMAVYSGDEPGGQYVGPRVVDGEIVPGHIERDAKPKTDETIIDGETQGYGQ